MTASPLFGGSIRTADYHTGGEPFRIVTEGVPRLEGRTVLERRAWAAEHLEPIRHLLVDEPRGHADMYGCFVTPPDDAGADLGVVFFHNEGYSTACGHGTIALVTWALESGRLPATAPETTVTVDVPSGRLVCVARVGADGRVASVRFRNVPSFVLDRCEVVTSRGPVAVEVGYGGAFYGSVDVRTIGLDVSRASLPALIALQRQLRPAVDAILGPVHPDEPALRGIYGIIFWQVEAAEPGAAPIEFGAGSGEHGAGHGEFAAPHDDPGAPHDDPGAPHDDPGAERVQRNVTVFADGEVDRSPCGSGTSARLALLDASGELPRGAVLRHRSIVDSVFTGRVIGDGPVVGGRRTVITEVEGSAFRTGRHEFEFDPGDPLGTGFLLR